MRGIASVDGSHKKSTAFIALASMVLVYVSSFSTFWMWMILAIGAFAFSIRRFGYPVVPTVMGVIPVPYPEELWPAP